MEQLQTKIEAVVEDYVEKNPEELSLFISAIENARLNNKDSHAQVENTHHFKRKLYEMPETLHAMLVKELSVDELIMFSTTQMGRWFAQR